MNFPDAARYTKVAVTLHWLIAALVVAQLILGWWMIDIPKQPVGARAFWFNLHKSIGMTIALLVLVRIAWRFRHPAPPLPASVPAWQRRFAAASHALLYACLLGMPLVGFLGSTFSGYPIKYFGITLPPWGYKSDPLKNFFSARSSGFCVGLHDIDRAAYGRGPETFIDQSRCGVLAHVAANRERQ